MKLELILASAILLLGCSEDIKFTAQESYALHHWSIEAMPTKRIADVRLSDKEIDPLLHLLQDSSGFEKVERVIGDGIVLVGEDQYIVLTQRYLYYIIRKYVDSVATYRKEIDERILNSIKNHHGIRSTLEQKE